MSDGSKQMSRAEKRAKNRQGKKTEKPTRGPSILDSVDKQLDDSSSVLSTGRIALGWVNNMLSQISASDDPGEAAYFKLASQSAQVTGRILDQKESNEWLRDSIAGMTDEECATVLDHKVLTSYGWTIPEVEAITAWVAEQDNNPQKDRFIANFGSWINEQKEQDALLSQAASQPTTASSSKNQKRKKSKGKRHAMTTQSTKSRAESLYATLVDAAIRDSDYPTASEFIDN